MSVALISTSELETEVLPSHSRVMVVFTAGWCGACREAKPIVTSFAQDQETVGVYLMDVDQESETADRFEVVGIPQALFFKDGALADRYLGKFAQPDLVEKVRTVFGDPA